MTPGPELDALVDRHVFKDPGDGKGSRPFSTDIAAAFEVVEKLDTLTLSRGDLGGAPVWVAQFVTEGPGFPVNVQSVCETAPHAICLAALKAVGYEIEVAA